MLNPEIRGVALILRRCTEDLKLVLRYFVSYDGITANNEFPHILFTARRGP